MNSRQLLLKITEKWPVKVLSVAAALMLSVFNRMNSLEARFFSVHLNAVSSDILVPSSSYSRGVRVGVRGEPNSIFPILEEDIEAFIDLSKYLEEGLYNVPVQVRRKGSALGAEPLEISVDPVELSIRLEQKVSRSIPVVPVFSGSVAEGYEFSGPFFVPAAVTAEGPRSVLEAQHEFNTETIDLEGRFDNLAVMVNLINDNPYILIHGNRIIECRGTIQRIEREQASNGKELEGAGGAGADWRGLINEETGEGRE